MPYAANGIVSQSPIEGGVQISDAEYRDAIQGMMNGLVVSIVGGFHLKAPAPEVVEPEPEPEPEPLTPEQIMKQYEVAIQLHQDNTARGLGYDDIKTAVTYADEPAVAEFQLEGQSLRAWRSLVWAYTYQQLARVKAGERTQPTVPEFILELPELVMLEAPVTEGAA